jgi:hypothetical protein
MEPQVAYAKRRKSGLEVPLTGRIWGENKFLIFAPPLWHDILVGICIIFGAFTSLRGGQLFSFKIPFVNGPPFDGVIPGGLLTTMLIFFAGLWAALSNERMIIDLRNKTYRRLEGKGPLKRSIRGNLSELEALVLTAEQYAGAGISAIVFYRLILYWKGQRQPALVAEKERHFISFGSPLNVSVQPMLHRGLRYAKAMGVPYYDNSHLAGKSPVPIL